MCVTTVTVCLRIVGQGLLSQQIAAVRERTSLRKRKDEGYREKVAALQERMHKLDEVCLYSRVNFEREQAAVIVFRHPRTI